MISFDDSDQLNTKIICQTSTAPAAAAEYSGNRGITIIRDNVNTAFASLGSVTPSASAQYDWLDAASFVDSQAVDVTVWLKGFLITRTIIRLFVFNKSKWTNQIVFEHRCSSC